MSAVERVCRLCLGIVRVGKVAFDIDDENGLIKNVNNIREMLLFCAPEIDVYASFQPVICETCLPTLVTAYNFKVKCMNTENTIRSYIQKNKIRDGSVVNLRSVVQQVRRLYQTGDPTAGVVCHAIEDKKETGINEKVLSNLKAPKVSNKSVVSSSSGASNSSGKNLKLIKVTPPPHSKNISSPTFTARKRIKPSLPRQAKDKDQDIMVVDSAAPVEDNVARKNTAPGTLRQDRRMAYLGLRRKSPERSKKPKESMNNNEEDSHKIIVLDDDLSESEVVEKTTPKIIISMNKDKSFSVNYDALKNQSQNSMENSPKCKPGETVISKINEVTVTRKLSNDEVLLMNYNEEPEICSIESSDDEEIEFIEPNHPMIDLVHENRKKTGSDDTSKDDSDAEPVTDSIKRKNTDDETDENLAKKSKIDQVEVQDTISEALKQQILEQNPEFAEYFEKKLEIKLARVSKKQLRPTKFFIKLVKTKLYGCKYCSYGSLDQLKAVDHFTFKHRLRGYYFCRYCDFNSKNLSDLGEHANTNHMAEMVKYLQKNTKDALYKCTVCNYNGGNMLDLRHHREKQHLKPLSNGTVVCPYGCPEFWSKMKEMHKHIEKYHECEHSERNSIFNCHICKYKVNSKMLLARHLNSHKKSEFIRCLMCPFSTKSKKVLERHSKKHSSEELQNSCGMVFMESRKKKIAYNDDYRITLDSLRRSAQESYETAPTSSSDLFDGPSLSEMLVMSLSENVEYVDLTDASTKPLECDETVEMETICLDDCEDVEKPSEASRSTQPKPDDENLRELVSEESENLSSHSNDEDCISTTTKDCTNAESSENFKENEEELVQTKPDINDDLDEKLDKNNQDRISTTTKDCIVDEKNVESFENSKENEEEPAQSKPDMDDNLEEKLEENETNNQQNKEIIVDSDEKITPTSSTSSIESYLTCKTSNLTKDVTELELSIKELNSVLDKNVSKEVDDENEDHNDILKQIDNFCQEVTSSTEIVEDMVEVSEDRAGESSESCSNYETLRQATISSTEVVEDIIVPHVDEEDKTAEETLEKNSKHDTEQTNEEQSETDEKATPNEDNTRLAKEIDNASREASTSEKPSDNSMETDTAMTVSQFVTVDKQSALERRCLLSSVVENFNNDLNSSQKELMVKKLSALEERFFVRKSSGSNCE